jgi:hypothetical protein
MKALPVAHAAGAARLYTVAGTPIWPYDDAETRTALIRIAELFDAPVAEEHPNPAPHDAIAYPRRGGIVVSAREDADEVAALYGHLTNRRMMTALDHGRLIEQSRVDVVVAPWDVLTTDFLCRLYRDPAWAPGLITGGSPRELLRQAVLRAAALALCGRLSRHRVDVRPLADHGLIKADKLEILGQQADAAQIKQALGSGSELLTVFTVGDGIDAGFGPLILCPMVQKVAEASGRTPACVVSGTCHRLQLPMMEALASGYLLSPDAIASRVLILHACWGIQPAGSLYDSGWGYGHRLASHDRLGAMLTTWQITIGSAADTEPLARDVARGMPLGQALARFNNAAASRRTGQLMCLLGDPELRVSTVAPPFRRSASGETTPREEQRQLAFLSAYLDTIVPKRESKSALTSARRAVSACLRKAWSGSAIDAPHEPSGTVVRQAVLRFLCRHGTIPTYHWMDLAYPVGSDDSGSPCLTCRQTTREVNLRLRVLGAGSRKLQLCPRCGLTEDRPATMGRIGLTFKEGVAYLHGSAPRGPWAASLLVRPHVGQPTFHPWPAGEDGRPLFEMPIFAQRELQGAGQLLLFMIEEASLWMARAQYDQTSSDGTKTNADMTATRLGEVMQGPS